MVEKELRSGDDPSLMGDTYMSNYAKDSEMEHMIKHAIEIEREILANDMFVARGDEYETIYEMAVENIQEVYKGLEDKKYDMDDVNNSTDLLDTLETHYAQNNKLNLAESQKDIAQLKQSIEDFQSSQEVLQQINRRKLAIGAEIKNHIATINEHRKDADMEEYHPKRKVTVPRKMRTIEDLLRK